MLRERWAPVSAQRCRPQRSMNRLSLLAALGTHVYIYKWVDLVKSNLTFAASRRCKLAALQSLVRQFSVAGENRLRVFRIDPEKRTSGTSQVGQTFFSFLSFNSLLQQDSNAIQEWCHFSWTNKSCEMIKGKGGRAMLSLHCSQNLPNSGSTPNIFTPK